MVIVLGQDRVTREVRLQNRIIICSDETGKVEILWHRERVLAELKFSKEKV